MPITEMIETAESGTWVSDVADFKSLYMREVKGIGSSAGLVGLSAAIRERARASASASVLASAVQQWPEPQLIT